MSKKIEELEQLAKIAGVEVKHSKAYQLNGMDCLLCGSGYHKVWNPYQNKEQAFDVLFNSSVTLQVNDSEIVVNDYCYLVSDYSLPHQALCAAICDGALNNLK